MVWTIFSALSRKSDPSKLLKDAFKVIEDKIPQWIQDAAEDDPEVLEVSIPLTLPITKADWDAMELKHSGRIQSPNSTDKDVMKHYPFLAQFDEWKTVTRLYGSANIGCRLEFSSPPDTQTDIEIIIFSKNNFNLRQQLDRILADSAAYRNERNL